MRSEKKQAEQAEAQRTQAAGKQDFCPGHGVVPFEQQDNERCGAESHRHDGEIADFVDLVVHMMRVAVRVAENRCVE